MKKTPLAFGALVSCLLAAAFPARATTATSLSSFGGIEEPTVIYHPSSNTFTTGDTFVNITDLGSGTFQMYLRFSTSSWDGDRDTTSTDRQRAEVKVLGNRQAPGETYEYASTWRTDSAMTVGNRFCHITQVKAYDGADTSDPLVATTLYGGGVVKVEKDSHDDTGLIGVRTFSWSPNTWTTVVNRLTTSSSDGASDGALLASVNGDAFSGVSNTPMYRAGATQYQPKWGLYRGVDVNQTFGNDYMQHKAVSANKVTAPVTVNMEAENIAYTASGATAAVQTDANSSNGEWIALESSDNAGDYIEFTTTSIPAGTYQVKMEWKGNTSRGKLTFKVDGTQLGSTLDQYSAAQTYPTTTFGTVTFGSAGTHKVRLTVAGKNSSSSSYWLSADKFSFVGQ